MLDTSKHPDASIEDYYRMCFERAREAIRAQDDEYILDVDPVEYVDYLIADVELFPILKDQEREISVEQTVRRVRVKEFGKWFEREVSFVKIEYPIEVVPRVGEVLSRRSREFYIDPMPIQLDEARGIIAFEVKLGDGAVDDAVENLDQVLDWRNSDIKMAGPRLRGQLESELERRKHNLAERKDLFEEVIGATKVSVKKKPNADARTIDLTVKKSVQILRQPPETGRSEDWVIDREIALEIVDLIYRAGLGFEAAPAVYEKFHEEELRTIVLGHLNAVFEAGATGETFSKHGKTDIFLVIPAGGILIAECKYWAGAARYSDTVDQIFRYLTWRHTYGIIITFSRNESLSGVVRNAMAAINDHETSKGDVVAVSDTHFQSSHAHTDDAERVVEMHHLFFNFHAPK